MTDDDNNEKPFIGYHIVKRSIDPNSILVEIWQDDPNNKDPHPANQWKLISSWCDLSIKTNIKNQKQDTNEKK